MEPTSTTTVASGALAGSTILIGGIILMAVSIAILYSRRSANKIKAPSINNILSEEGRYNEYKSLIEDAIEDSDFDFLELNLNSRMRDFPDLIRMIKHALKNR